MILPLHHLSRHHYPQSHQHKPVLLEVVSLDDSSSVCKLIAVIQHCRTFCSMTWIEIGGTTYKVGGFVIRSFSRIYIVDLKCFFWDMTLVFNKHYHSYEVRKCVPCELIGIEQCDIDFHVHSLHLISSINFIYPKYHVVDYYRWWVGITRAFELVFFRHLY